MLSGNGVSREDTGIPPAQGTKLGRGANFRCLMSDAPIPGDYIKAEGKAGRMGARLMAIVAEGDRGRVYLAPTPEQEAAARKAAPEWKPDVEFFQQALGFRVGNYGMTKWSDLFTPRQLVALTTFSDLVTEAIARVKQDVLGTRASRPLKQNAGGTPALPEDDLPLRDGGTGTTAYAEAVGVYLGVALSRLADMCNGLCIWEVTKTQVRHLFVRQAIAHSGEADHPFRDEADHRIRSRRSPLGAKRRGAVIMPCSDRHGSRRSSVFAWSHP